MVPILKSLSFLFLTLSLSFFSCNSDSTSSSTSTSDSTSGKDKMMTDTSSSSSSKTVSSNNPNQDAINYAVPKNTKEIIWIKAGITNGMNKELKAHAKMMLVDHENLASKVKELIAKKNYSVPSFDTANEVNINDKKGADWDKAWTAKMIDDHKEILDMFGKAQKNVTDPDLNALITKTVPVVQSHLEMAEKLNQKLK